MAANVAVNTGISSCLLELARNNPRLVVLNADVAKSVGVREFGEKCPGQFLQMGVSEQDMLLTAAGLASTGLIPVVTTFAIFAALRAAEQIRTFVAYPGLNVKILVSHAGVTPGMDGVTHQTTEDLAVMRVIPGMTVIEPFDAESASCLLELAILHDGPVYFRMHREKLPVHDIKEPLQIGTGLVLRPGRDVTIVAMGSMVTRSLEAAVILAEDGVSAAVVAIHTLKPFDEDLVVEMAAQTGAVVTAEEHSIFGGLGDAVSLCVSRKNPVPVRRVGVQDTFAQSGTYPELVQHYGLSAHHIVTAARLAVNGKKRN